MRENFGKLGYIMALAGSAIGLGNIWRFPYIVGEHGGAAFIIVYLVCSVFISIPILVCEAVIGRRSRKGTYRALETLAPGTGWKWVGLITIVAAFLINAYYCVVGGWSVDFLVRACIKGPTSVCSGEETSMFASMSSSTWEPLLAHLAFLSISALIVRLGIKKGIEKFTKLIIPVLFVIITAMAVYSVTLPGAREGVRYLLKPDWSEFNTHSIAYALGQSFFSMSLGIGCVLTYSSYMQRHDNILASGIMTSVFDSMFAIIAGFAVMPAVFSAGIEPGAGPALVFETIPYIFARIGVEAPILGYIITVLFFVAILMAALTSSVSLFEVCVSHLVDNTRVTRSHACLLSFAGFWSLGILCSLSFGVLADFKICGQTFFGVCDVLTSNYLMLIGALAFSLFVGWKMGKENVRDEFTNAGTVNVRIFGAMYALIKWVIPVMIVLIFITNLIL